MRGSRTGRPGTRTSSKPRGFATKPDLRSRTSSQILATQVGVSQNQGRVYPQLNFPRGKGGLQGIYFGKSVSASQTPPGWCLRFRSHRAQRWAILLDKERELQRPMPPSSPAHSYRQCPWCGRSFKAYRSFGADPWLLLHVDLSG